MGILTHTVLCELSGSVMELAFVLTAAQSSLPFSQQLASANAHEFISSTWNNVCYLSPERLFAYENDLSFQVHWSITWLKTILICKDS